MGDIIRLNMPTRADVSVEKVCDAAKENCKFVFIAGMDNDGGYYFAASSGKEGSIDDILWLLEKFKFKLMNGEFK